VVVVRCVSAALDVASNLGRMSVLYYVVCVHCLESPLEKLLMLMEKIADAQQNLMCTQCICKYTLCSVRQRPLTEPSENETVHIWP
jgi:hypothetical protein